MTAEQNLSVTARRGAVAVVPNPNSSLDVPECEREYLVIRRSARVIAPNRLCFPGGGLLPNESACEAAEREFFEETGRRAKVRRKIWENITPWNVRLDWFLAVLDGESTEFFPDSDEVSEIFWLDFRRLLRHEDTLESNEDFLRLALDGQFDLRAG